MSTPQNKPVPKSTILSTIPSADQVVLVNGYDPIAKTAKTLVQVTTSDNTITRAFALFAETSDNPVPPATVAAGAIPAGYTELSDQSGGVFKNTTVPISNLLDNPPPASNNKKLVVGIYSGTALKESASPLFTAMPPTTTGAVDAKACLWLTYAQAGFTGPFGEKTSTPAFVSLPIPVPDTAAKATVTATGGLWRHDPAQATETGAAGRPGTDQPLDPAHSAGYKDAVTNNHNIQTGTFPLNRLVALWEYDDITISTTELDVGTGKDLTIVIGPAPGNKRPVRLRLGFHDGFEWSNNQGAVTVTITWS